MVGDTRIKSTEIERREREREILSFLEWIGPKRMQNDVNLHSYPLEIGDHYRCAHASYIGG